MLQIIYTLTPYVPKFFGFSHWFSKRLSRVKLFRVIQFWQEHECEFTFTKGYVILKGFNFKLRTESAYDFFQNYFQFRKNYKIYKKNGQVFVEIEGFTFLSSLHGIIELAEIFEGRCYEFFDVKDKVVLDIGGFIGDSAIYFVWKGAKKVVVYEPNPHIFEIAKKNIKINKLTNKIQVRNEAVAKECGVHSFFVQKSHLGGSSIQVKAKNSLKIQVNTVSLSSIIEELSHVDLIKIDCEGAEYDILPAAYAEGALKNIDNIVMEVHGPLKPIVNILQRAEFIIVKKVRVSSELFLLFGKNTQVTH